MGFSRQEYWSGLAFPSLGDLPDLLHCRWILYHWATRKGPHINIRIFIRNTHTHTHTHTHTYGVAPDIHMCMYTHTHTHTHIYLWSSSRHTYVYVYRHTHTFIYGVAPDIHTCMYMHTHTHTHTHIFMGFPGGSVVKNPPAMQDTWVWSLGQEDPLEKGMPTHSCILTWRNPLHLYVCVFVLIDWSINR